MAFGMSPFPLRFGSRQGGGPTNPVTIDNWPDLASELGLTQSRAGTAWGETGVAETPVYVERSANVLALGAEQYGGNTLLGPIISSEQTNLALHSRNATSAVASAVWSLSNVTAVLAAGGLRHGSEWTGTSYFDESPPNFNDTGKWQLISSATAIGSALTFTAQFSHVRHLTFAGGQFDTDRVAKFPMAALFSVDMEHVSGNLGLSTVFRDDSYGGDNDIRAMTFDSPSQRKTFSFIKIFDAFTSGVESNIQDRNASNFGSVNVHSISLKEIDVHTLLTATANGGTALQAITSASADRSAAFWLSRAVGTGTIEMTMDNGSTWEEIELSEDPLRFDISWETLTNPTIGYRFGTSGDAIKFYQSDSVAAKEVKRPFSAPTLYATQTSSAGTLTRTLDAAPTSIGFDMVVRVPMSATGKRLLMLGTTADRVFDLYFHDDTTLRLYGTNTSVESFTADETVVPGEVIRIAVDVSGSLASLKVNDAAAQTDTPSAALPSSTALYFGHLAGGTNHLDGPIAAFRNRGGLGPGLGWNL